MGISSDALTIVLTLKGRHLFTLRWLWHANKINLPFSVLIADGDVHPSIKKLILQDTTFPNLRITYKEYRDSTYKDFYKKCVDAFSNVRTRYVMMSDNDDFISTCGLIKIIEYLDKEPEYVCAGGLVAGFSIRPHSNCAYPYVGNLSSFSLRYSPSYCTRDLLSDSKVDAVLDEIESYMPIYYNLYRTEAIQCISQEALDLNFTDLHVHELYLAARTVTMGKVKSIPSIFSYYRQRDTSLRKSYDFFEGLVRSDMPRDAGLMASNLARQLIGEEGAALSACKEKILNCYANLLRKNVMGALARYRFPRLSKAKQELRSLSSSILPLTLSVWKDKCMIDLKLREKGAILDEINQFKAEILSIEETLLGKDFIIFVQTHAPELLNERG